MGIFCSGAAMGVGSMQYETIEYDVLIVGAGGAGLRAALELAQSNLSVAVVSKVYAMRSHTIAAQGGVNAALGNNGQADDWRYHMYDTVTGSDWMGDQDAIEYMCREAPQTIIELEHMGLPFSRDEAGKIYQRAFGGQTTGYGEKLAHRTCCAADRTGHALLHTLFQRAVAESVTILNEWLAMDLIRDHQGRVAGVSAIELKTGRCYFLKAKSTILATGGGGRVFQSSTNAAICTGDGMGMVARAGLWLQDMEMWQFHPTGIYGVGILITEGSRGEGGYLINADGERFMARYNPHLKDLSCRDVVSRCSMIEIREGRGCGPNKDHVLLKLDHLGEAVLQERLPGITEAAITYAGVNPAKEPIPVVPTCHYMMGGIPTTRFGEVVDFQKGRDAIVPGLYAVGECACVSVHGANRLGANSLLDIVVFGRAAGKQVKASMDSGIDEASINRDDIEKGFTRYQRWMLQREGVPIHRPRSQLQAVMQQHFGVFRDGAVMAEGIAILQGLREQIQEEAALATFHATFNTNLLEALELDNLIEIGLATAHAAHARQESRGAHSRVDFPERDDVNWHTHLLVNQAGQQQKRPINMQPHDVPPVPLAERK